MGRYTDKIVLQEYEGVIVLRDDLLLGGTKSIFIEDLLNPNKSEYVYATPVYGGFQIALAGVCKRIGKQAVIFCAKRKIPHKNSLTAKAMGAKVYQVPYGYLSNVQSKAKKYCNQNDAQYLTFGADSPLAINAISKRMQAVIRQIGQEPDLIYCAIGSGTLVKGIIKGTKNAKVCGVMVGKECTLKHERLKIIKYPKAFEKISKCQSPFPSCENYDLKAWELLLKTRGKNDNIFFWNVL